MNFKSLNRTELDQKMKSLALRERELLSEVLLVIREIDGRRLFLDMGFPNLFSYLVSLGYSEGAAQRRIDAARLLNEVPELGKKIENGSVNLSQISLVQKAIREAKKNSQPITKEDKNSLLEQVSNKTYQETQKTIAQFLDLPVQQAEVKSTQKDDSVRVTLTLSKELYEKINRAQELLSHSLPSKELAAYLEFVSEKVIQQKTGFTQKVQRQIKLSQSKPGNSGCNQMALQKLSAVQNNQQDAKVVLSNHKESKSADESLQKTEFTATSAVKADSISKTKGIPANVRKQLLRTQKTCHYKDPITGRRCESKWHVQADHRQARWAGGSHQSENLQLLCRAHNLHKYKAEMNIKYLSSL